MRNISQSTVHIYNNIQKSELTNSKSRRPAAALTMMRVQYERNAAKGVIKRHDGR